jgi:hypothetical protein
MAKPVPREVLLSVPTAIVPKCWDKTILDVICRETGKMLDALEWLSAPVITVRRSRLAAKRERPELVVPQSGR